MRSLMLALSLGLASPALAAPTVSPQPPSEAANATASPRPQPEAANDLSSLSPAQQRAVRTLVLDEMKQHPDLLLKIIAEAAIKVEQARNTLTDPTQVAKIHQAEGRPQIGAQNGFPVTVFSDPDCPACRMFASVLAALHKDDPDLHLSVVTLPIINKAFSPAAAVTETAYDRLYPARAWDLFMAIESRHDILDQAGVQAVAKTLGLPAVVPTEADHARVAANVALAGNINLTGTPTLVIGNFILRQGLPLADLKRVIADVKGKPATGH